MSGPLGLDVEAAPRFEAVLDFQKVCAQNMPQRPSSTLHKHICLQAALARCLHALNARYIAHDIYDNYLYVLLAACQWRTDFWQLLAGLLATARRSSKYQ